MLPAGSKASAVLFGLGYGSHVIHASNGEYLNAKITTHEEFLQMLDKHEVASLVNDGFDDEDGNNCK